ncbi:MAG: hypothetical protein IKH01_11695 [Prevotella sp.]|nr:hypothetical protein [Prevotella sp.]
MDATKEQIERLLKETSDTIGCLYATILEDISILNACDDSVSSLFKLVRELRRDTSYILVDLHSALHSLLSTERPIEKRFHLMFISADMLECYKLLYNFGNKQKHTVWFKIGRVLVDSKDTNKNAHSELLLKIYETISSMLEAIGNAQEKESRDLTYHYDDDLLKVYHCILKFDSEEKVIERMIQFIDVMRSILFFCNIAEDVETLKGHSLPSVINNNIPLFTFQTLIAEKLDGEGKLREALNVIINKTQRIDQAARLKEGFKNMQNYLQNNWPDSKMPELDNMNAMSNTHLLLQIAMADIATATLAYLNAGSEHEYPLVLRRLTITRVSTLCHIYGYNEAEHEKSLWNAITIMMPNTNKALIEEVREIDKELNNLVNENDKADRLLYVHLLDNKTKMSNVPLIVKKAENMNPFLEFDKAKMLINVMSRIQKFLKALMDELGKNAHEQAKKSKDELKSKVQAIRDLINKSECSVTQRAEFIQKFDRFDSFVDSIYRE